METLIAQPRTITLKMAVAETLAAKEKANLRKQYVNGLKQYLNLFMHGREELPIDSITTEIIEQWFSDRAEIPVTRSSNIGRLSSVFQLAWRRRWITENPCRRLERHTADYKAPSILTVEQVRSALSFTREHKPRWLAYLALAVFGGVRPTEIMRVSWNNVRMETGTITIDAAASKVRRRRIVHLMPVCVEWLRMAKELGAGLGTLKHMGQRRYIRRLATHLGFEGWPHDVLRHTAASYWLAHWRDAGKVAFELGNSAGILMRHYSELVTADDAAAFWALLPENVSHGIQNFEI